MPASSNGHLYAPIVATKPADVVMSPDGATLYAAGEDGNIRVYDVATRALLATWDVGTRLGGIDVSPDGSFLMAVEREPLATTTGSSPPHDNTTTVTVYKVDIATGQATGYPTVMVGTGGVFFDLAIGSDGDVILAQSFRGVTGSGQLLYRLDLDTGQYTNLSQFVTEEVMIWRDEDGGRILIGPSNSSSAPLFIYEPGLGLTHINNNTADGVRGTVQTTSAIHTAANLVVQNSGTLNVYDADLNYQFELSALHPQFRGEGIVGLAFDAAGDNLFVLDQRTDTITQLATGDWSLVRTFAVGADVNDPSELFTDGDFGNQLLLSPDGRYFTVVTGSGVMLVENDGLDNDFTGTAAADDLAGGLGADVLRGEGGADRLDGGAGDDQLDGGEGDDIFYVDEGHDVVAGGGGIDTLVIDYSGSPGQLFAETLGPVPGDSVSGRYASFGDASRSVEFTSIERFLITGTAQADDIIASGMEAIVDGGGGDDFIQTANGNDTLRGGDGNDLLNSLNGNDILDGGSGADEMTGGAGNDVYFVDSVGDVVDEVDDNGFDRVLSSVSWALTPFSEVEMLTTTDNFAATAIDLSGNSYAQYLYGNAGANQLDGGGGGDVMYGFEGDDRFFIRNAADRAVELAAGGFDRVLAGASFTLGAGSHVEMITTTDNFGTAAINLTGNELFQYLYGNAGANEIDGGGGGDVMYGFEGDDCFYIRNAADRVVESAGGGFDRVLAGASFTLEAGSEVEMFTTIDNLSTAAINLTGNALSQYLYGNAGANEIDGGGGGDVMYGFEGDDRFYVRNAADRVVEFAGEGFDRVLAAASFTLEASSEVEMLTTVDNLATTAINLTGNALSQYLYGNAGANTLDGGGGGGEDAMYGFEGDDFFIVRNASDRAVEAAGGGSDRVFAAVDFTLGAGSEIELLSTTDDLGTGAINLTGNELFQYLYGNEGANVLDGKSGGDSLFGFGGADGFAFTTALGGGNIDILADFVSGTDKILLDDAIFVGIGPPGALNPDAFNSEAFQADDRIIYSQTGLGFLYFDADGSGPGAAVAFANVLTGTVITASDFVVI